MQTVCVPGAGMKLISGFLRTAEVVKYGKEKKKKKTTKVQLLFSAGTTQEKYSKSKTIIEHGHITVINRLKSRAEEDRLCNISC